MDINREIVRVQAKISRQIKAIDHVKAKSSTYRNRTYYQKLLSSMEFELKVLQRRAADLQS